MPGFNAIGANALGSGGTGVGTAANFACSMSAASSLSASLTTKITLAVTLVATTALTASFTSAPPVLAASLSSPSTMVANMTTAARFQAALSSASALTADLTSTAPPISFTPSAARTIYVISTTPVFTGSKWWNLADPKKPRGVKDPDAVVDVTFDWSDWLNDIGAASISDVTFTLNGLNNVATFFNNTTATVFVSGGALNSASTIACKIKTNTTPSRTDERTVYLDIVNE